MNNKKITVNDDDDPVDEKPMSADEFLEMKRMTEKGNTYFLKATEAVEQEEIKVKQTFMNPQQLAIYESK